MYLIFDMEQDKKIDNDSMVKMTEYNGEKKLKITETLNTQNNFVNIKKLDKDRYYNKIENKIKLYNKSEVRSISGIRHSMKKVSDYIRNNFNGGRNEIFVTLTYSDSMRDMEQLKKDYDYFWKQLTRQMPDLEYLYVVEMQEERNSLHMHALIKDTIHSELHIPIEELSRLWNKGYVWVTRINMRDTIRFVIDESKDERTAIGRVRKYMTKIKTKENVPRDKNIYSKSKGIIAPTTIQITNKEAQQFASDNEYEFYYGYSGDIRTLSGFVVGSIKGKFYKKKNKEDK